MFRFIKKYWLLILISLMASLFIVNNVLESRQPSPNIPTPISTSTATYRSLLPGASTQDEVNELLGFPLKEGEQNGDKIAEYESTNKYRNHIITFENGKIALVREIVNSTDGKNSDTITNEYGEPPYILYDQYPAATFHLYVYPQNGIAFLGHEDKTLLEIWYFEPMTIDEFINKWGGGYGKEKPKGPTTGY